MTTRQHQPVRSSQVPRGLIIRNRAGPGSMDQLGQLPLRVLLIDRVAHPINMPVLSTLLGTAAGSSIGEGCQRVESRWRPDRGALRGCGTLLVANV
jgi:hypothetical protein